MNLSTRVGPNILDGHEISASTAAFFDVDDTLVRGFTVASYSRFILPKLEDVALRDALLDLERRAPTYSDRQALTVDCFRLFAGQSWSRLLSWGAEWYECVGRHQLIPETVTQVGAHRRRGDGIFLISGSWLPCVLPLAEDLDATDAACCTLEVHGDVLSGEATQVMLAQRKAETVRSLAGQHRLDLAHCFAYGDDVSDVPMLASVGHSIVVRPTPALAEIAPRFGWTILPTS